MDYVVVVRTINLNLAREGDSACSCRGLSNRLPIGVVHVGKQNALWPKRLQAYHVQITAIEPNLASDFGRIAASQYGKDVISRIFVVELFVQHRLAFHDFWPEQCIKK